MKQDYRTKHKWTIDDPENLHRHATGNLKSQRRWLPWILVCILLVALGVGGAAWYQQHHAAAPVVKKAPVKTTTDIPLTLPHHQ